MICADMESLAAALEPMRAILALDPGTKTIGVAASDRMLTSANPVCAVKRGKFAADAARLLEIARERDVGGIIVGLPRNMDGSEGPRCQSSRALARNLEGVTDLPIAFWDERLSTVAAERALLEADLTRKRRSTVVDAVAAAYILQGALDRLRHMRDER